MKAITIRSEWEQFVSQCYPKGTVPAQRRQLNRAFYAGAWTTLKHLSVAFNNLPTDQAVAVFEKLLEEAEKAMDNEIIWLKASLKTPNQDPINQ